MHRLIALIFATGLVASAQAQTLAEAYRDYWYTGVSVNQWQVEAEKAGEQKFDYTGMVSTDQTADWPVITKHFNWVVAENCMKSEVIHPQEGVYDFTLADQFVNKAKAAGLKVHGHCLIWHSQCPRWFHYDKDGKLVWEQKIPAKITFDCLRRANGNTLVSHLDAVTEYTPDHQIAWRFSCEDAPQLKLANLCGIWEQKNGNLVVGTYANGAEDGSRATAFEVTREKHIAWSYAAAGKRFSMMTAFPVGGWQWPVAWVAVTPEDEAKMADIVGTRLSVLPKKPRKVLMAARAFGYSHNDALAYGRRSFEMAADRTGAFSMDFTEDVAVLGDAAKLAQYDAVVINNCTAVSVKRFPEIEKALVEYVKGGKGLCLIHSALDSFYDSPAIADMNGGLFWGHPWMAGGTWLFKNEEPSHPLMAMFNGMPPSFKLSDEIYMHSSPSYSREKDRVLISMDLSDKPTSDAADRWAKRLGADKLRADRDFAVSWTRPYGAGRVFYTSFGHDKRAFIDKPRLLHMLAGLQYCTGDLECGDAPRK